MKSRKAIMCLLLVAVMLIGVFSLSGCVSNDELAERIEAKLQISEDGFFGYHVIDDNDGSKYAVLVRLTKEGQDEIERTGKLYAMPTMGGYLLKKAGVVWYEGIFCEVIYYPLGIPQGENNWVILPYACQHWGGAGERRGS